MTRRELTRRLATIGLSSSALLIRPGLAQIGQPARAEPTSAWPDSSNTGVPAHITLTPYDGSLGVNTPGAVINGLDIRGTVTISASNVTLMNCRVTAANWYVIDISSAATDVTVQDCTINGVGAGNDGSNGINGSGKFLRNNIYNVENGINVGRGKGPTLIQDNYIHDLLASGAPHYDGIQIDGGQSNVTIRHNTVIVGHVQTSALMIDNWAGPVSNIVVDNNLLVGGGYAIYVDGQFNNHPISGVSITNNHMGAGSFGIVNFNRTSPVYTGNVNDGAALARTLGWRG